MQTVIAAGGMSFVLYPRSLACSDILEALNVQFSRMGSGVVYWRTCTSNPVAVGTGINFINTTTGETNAYTVTTVSTEEAVAVSQWPVQSLIVLLALFFAATLGFRTGYRA